MPTGDGPMDHDHYSDSYIADILNSVRTIALTGASPNPARPSNGVMGYLLSRGYQVIPVNPGQAGKQIHGQLVVGRLEDIPVPVDMIDVFRASEYPLQSLTAAVTRGVNGDPDCQVNVVATRQSRRIA